MIWTLLFMVGSSNLGFAQIFADVEDSHWARVYIEELYREGIFMGKNPETFSPQHNVTNQEIAVLLTRIIKPQEGELKQFRAINDNRMNALQIDEYAKDAVSYVWTKNIMAEGVFYENGKMLEVRKDDLCVYLIRLLQLEQEARTYVAEKDFQPFQDEALITNTKKGFVYLAREKGIVNGDEAGKFNPQNKVTRAEVAKMLYITKNLLEKKDDKQLENYLVPDETIKINGVVYSITPNMDGFSIVVQDQQGVTHNFGAKEAVPFYRDAESSSISTIVAGEIIAVEYNDKNQVVRIDGQKIQQVLLTGRIGDLLPGGNAVIFETKVNEQWLPTTYPIDTNTKIYLDGQISSFSELSKGQLATMTISNNRVTLIQAKKLENVITGILEEYQMGENKLQVRTKGLLKSFEISSKSTVLRNNHETSLSALKMGDRVVVTVDGESVLSVVSTGENAVISGKIDSIYISKKPKLFFVDVEETLNVYRLHENCTYRDNLTNKTIYDIRLGQMVEAEVKDSEIVAVRWNGTSNNVQEIGILKGIDILNAQITLEKDGIAIPVFTGLSQIFDATGTPTNMFGLHIGKRIAVTGQYKNNRLEAITIVEMP